MHLESLSSSSSSLYSADDYVRLQQARKDLKRYQVFRTQKSRNFLCVCAARDGAHALKMARQLFVLPREAFALLERA